jgi:hypothetical protein
MTEKLEWSFYNPTSYSLIKEWGNLTLACFINKFKREKHQLHMRQNHYVLLEISMKLNLIRMPKKQRRRNYRHANQNWIRSNIL